MGYGMTGSGKTYSMEALHRKLPVDLFARINAAGPSGLAEKATVRFHAYELLGKRCFDLADGKARFDLADGEAEREMATKTEVFMRVGTDGMTNMCGITEHEVTGPDALL